jgi:hypothetical protein
VKGEFCSGSGRESPRATGHCGRSGARTQQTLQQPPAAVKTTLLPDYDGDKVTGKGRLATNNRVLQAGRKLAYANYSVRRVSMTSPLLHTTVMPLHCTFLLPIDAVVARR